MTASTIFRRISRRTQTHRSSPLSVLRDRRSRTLLSLSALSAGLLVGTAHADTPRTILIATTAKNNNVRNKVRIAQAPPATPDPGNANAPAAQPEEKPKGLEVPIGPDKPNDATPAAPPADTTPTTPTTPANPPTDTVDNTNTVPAIIGDVTASEGREISDVRVVGNRVVPAASIIAQVRTQRGAAFSSRQVELDRARIDQLGFFAVVQAQVAPDLNDTEKVIVTFIVTENRVVTGYRFDGNTSLKNDELTAVLGSKTGVVLNRNTVNADVTAIQKLYTAKGYAVLVKSATQDDDGTLVFVLTEAHISDIKLSGLKKTRPSLVRRQIRTKVGDLFDSNKLRKDLNTLYDTQFFDDATFKVDDDPNAPGSVIVTFLLKERRTGQFSVGVGFDSRSKLSGFFTVSENNLRGTGQRALASIETGSERNFELSYGNPYIGAKNASYDVSVYDRTIYREPQLVKQVTGNAPDKDIVSLEDKRTGVRANFTRPLDFDRKRTLVFGMRAEKAQFLQQTDQGATTPLGASLDSSGHIVAGSIGFVRDVRDLRTDPSSGSRESLIVEQAVKALGSSNNFTKIDLDLRRYIPLQKAEKPGAQPKLVLAGRVVFSRALNQLPPFEQYYIGGPDTVRGYETETQYGDNQLYGNLELRYRFNRQLQAVIFSDAGTAYGGQFSSDKNANFLTSVGVGVRVVTPIGPIRLDVGYGKDGARTHFAIGPTF